MSQLEGSQTKGTSSYWGWSAFYSVQSFQMIRWGSPSLGRAVCSVRLYLIQQHPHRKTQNNVCPNVWAAHGPAKLTHKMNHSTRRLIVPLPADKLCECGWLPLCFCFSFCTMGGTFRIHHSFHTKTRSIHQSPVSESFLPYAWTPARGQLCSGAETPAETSAGPHHGLRLSLPNPAHSFSFSPSIRLLCPCLSAHFPEGPADVDVNILKEFRSFTLQNDCTARWL